MSLPEPIPAIMLEPLVRAALIEDLGRAGDITTAATIPASTLMEGVIAPRQSGVVAATSAVVSGPGQLPPVPATVVVEAVHGSYL